MLLPVIIMQYLYDSISYASRVWISFNTRDMTLFILSHTDIFSSNWWSMSKDTILLCSLYWVPSLFWIIGWYIKKLSIRSSGRFWFPQERRTIEPCFCCLGIIYIYSSWAVVSWVCLVIYMKPLGVTGIFSDDFNSICNKHFELCWLDSDVSK